MLVSPSLLFWDNVASRRSDGVQACTGSRSLAHLLGYAVHVAKGSAQTFHGLEVALQLSGLGMLCLPIYLQEHSASAPGRPLRRARLSFW